MNDHIPTHTQYLGYSYSKEEYIETEEGGHRSAEDNVKKHHNERNEFHIGSSEERDRVSAGVVIELGCTQVVIESRCMRVLT